VREVTVLVPLLVLTILFGFYPAPILDATAASVNLIADNFGKAIGAAVPLVAAAH
jgi:NADH-quinone oxidoreductase subunit M